LGFDSDATPQGGDPFVPGAQNVTGVTVAAGQSATLTVAVRPSGTVGTTVPGVINIVQRGNDVLTTALETPALASSYQVVGAFSYRYQVVPGVPTISGTVSSAGGPSAGVRAVAFSPQGQEVNFGTSDAQGHYSIDGLPAGPYTVCFDATKGTPSPPTGLLSSCYDNTAWDGTSAPPTGTQTVTVPASGGPVTGIDTTLQPGAGIQGTVTNSGGTPLPGVSIRIFDAAGTLVASPTSAGDGSYQAVDLPGGATYVCWEPTPQTPPGPNGGYANECDDQPWDGLTVPTSAKYTPINLIAGTMNTVNITDVTTSAITGSITNPAGQSLGSIIFVYDTSGNLASVAVSNDGDASYLVGGLAAGTYTVCVTAFDSGYDSQCYNSVTWPVPGGPPADGATPVNVAAQATAGGINFVLNPTTTANTTATAQLLARLAKQSPALANALRQHAAAVYAK
jgi:hypothetical protein